MSDRQDKANRRFQEFINDAGGLYSIRQMLSVTGLTASELDKAVKRGEILYLREEEKLYFPTAQIADNKVIRDIELVLHALPDGYTDQDVLRFFLTPVLGQGKNPLMMLREDNSISAIGYAKVANEQVAM